MVGAVQLAVIARNYRQHDNKSRASANSHSDMKFTVRVQMQTWVGSLKGANTQFLVSMYCNTP